MICIVAIIVADLIKIFVHYLSWLIMDSHYNNMASRAEVNEAMTWFNKGEIWINVAVRTDGVGFDTTV